MHKIYIVPIKCVKMTTLRLTITIDHHSNILKYIFNRQKVKKNTDINITRKNLNSKY